MAQNQNQNVPAPPPGFVPVPESSTPNEPQPAAPAGFAPVPKPPVPEQQPGFIKSAVENSPLAALEPPQSPTEDMIAAAGASGPAGSTGALAAWRAAKGIVETGQRMVESTKADYAASKAAFHKAVQDFHQARYGHAVGDVVAGAEIMGTRAANPLQTEGITEGAQDAMHSYQNLQNPETRSSELGRIVGKAVTAGTALVGGSEGAAEAEGSTLFKNPFRTEISGENFATSPMRSGVNAEAGTAATRQIAGEAAGVPGPVTGSLRDVWKPAIDAREAASKFFYKQLDDIDPNWGSREQELQNVRTAIRDQGGTRGDDWDQAMNAKKIRLEMQQQEVLDKLPPNTAATAKRLWTEKSRLEDLNDIFNKKSNVSGVRPEMMKPGVKGLPAEQYNWKGIARDINALPPNELEQMVGYTNAQNLTAIANLAAKQGWVNGVMLGAFKRALMFTGADKLVHLVP